MDFLATGIVFGLLSGLSGYSLLAGLSALLLVEECGIPLPFAPGDLLLVLCGMTIAIGHLDPTIAVAIVSVAVISGALIGRELFDRIGARLVFRLADHLRVRVALDWLAQSLRKHGSTAVFFGRLTPGLRVHTTEAAGLAGIGRATFVAGLLPAVAIYEMLFMGLGYWAGPSAGRAIHHYTSNPSLAVIGIPAAMVCAVMLRWVFGFIQRRLPTSNRLSESAQRATVDD